MRKIWEGRLLENDKEEHEGKIWEKQEREDRKTKRNMKIRGKARRKRHCKERRQSEGRETLEKKQIMVKNLERRE